MSSEKSSKGNFESAKDKLLQPDKHAEYRAKDQSKYFDPCQEAADRSIRCLHRNPTDKDLCSDYFQAYRNCKKAWLDQKKAGKWF